MYAEWVVGIVRCVSETEDNLQDEWELYASALAEDSFDGDEGGPTSSEA